MPRKTKDIVCYAAALGNCSGTQSIEHYISQGIFTNKMLTIEGQKWLQGQSKTLNIEKVGLPIMCDRHNRRLSPLDAFTKDLVKKLDQMRELSKERQKLKRGMIMPKITHHVNATLLEQWMIKCAVGAIFENKDLRWHLDDADATSPPLKILKALFGYEKLQPPMGLYYTMAVGNRISNVETASVVHLHHRISGKYIGAFINLMDHKFLIWFSDESLENYKFSLSEEFDTEKSTLFGPGHNQPAYHMEKLEFIAKGLIAGEIFFDWDQDIKRLDE